MLDTAHRARLAAVIVIGMAVGKGETFVCGDLDHGDIFYRARLSDVPPVEVKHDVCRNRPRAGQINFLRQVVVSRVFGQSGSGFPQHVGVLGGAILIKMCARRAADGVIMHLLHRVEHELVAIDPRQVPLAAVLFENTLVLIRDALDDDLNLILLIATRPLEHIQRDHRGRIQLAVHLNGMSFVDKEIAAVVAADGHLAGDQKCAAITDAADIVAGPRDVCVIPGNAAAAHNKGPVGIYAAAFGE